jgi:ADP-heptose:LPS heptosyltransferase
VWRWLLDTVAPLGIAAERGPAHGAPPGVTPAGAPEPGGRLGTMPVAPPAGVEPLALPAEWRERARRVLADAGGRGGPTLIVHPGAGGAWKRWAAERFADVVARVVEATGARPIVHQGPADAEPAARLHGLLEGRAGRLVEPDLPVLAGALGEAAGYLGGDSGVSQLAAAVGAAAVVVYPEGTRARWAPWCATALAVTGDGDPGRPAEVARLVIDRISGRPGATSSAWR